MAPLGEFGLELEIDGTSNVPSFPSNVFKVIDELNERIFGVKNPATLFDKVFNVLNEQVFESVEYAELLDAICRRKEFVPERCDALEAHGIADLNTLSFLETINHVVTLGDKLPDPASRLQLPQANCGEHV